MTEKNNEHNEEAKQPVEHFEGEEVLRIQVCTDESEDDEEEYDSPLPPEYYEQLRRKSYERHVALGIDDLPDEASRDFCETMALAKIVRENIIEEADKRKVYEEMKHEAWNCIERAKAHTPDPEHGQAIREDIKRRRIAEQFRRIERLAGTAAARIVDARANTKAARNDAERIRAMAVHARDMAQESDERQGRAEQTNEPTTFGQSLIASAKQALEWVQAQETLPPGKGGGVVQALTPEQHAEIEALKALPDDQIDTSDIPEVTDFTGFQRGLFYSGRKRQGKAEQTSEHQDNEVLPATDDGSVPENTNEDTK